MGNGLDLWEVAQICGDMALLFDKRLKNVENDLDLWEVAQICGEMALLFDKRLKNVENDLESWEMAKVFVKWLNPFRTDYPKAALFTGLQAQLQCTAQNRSPKKLNCCSGGY